MTRAATPPISLQAFLALPETKPASEYWEGKIIQKPMPKGKHSQLQLKLCNAINAVVAESEIAYALPELRCTFGNRSLVPDIAVFRWSRIPFDPDGEIPNDFLIYPDWMIEIRSPDQSSNQVTGNILYCLQHGCQLGWLIDRGDRSVLVLKPQQQPELYETSMRLPVLDVIGLDLTPDQVFDWLKLK